MTTHLRRNSAIRLSAMVLLLGAVAAWMHRLALLDILTIGFNREEQSHILLAPFVAVWLFLLRRVRLRRLQVAPTLWGVAIIGLGWLLSRVAIEVDVQVVWHAGAILSLFGCVVTMTGFEAVRTFAPAFAAMVFLIPVPAAAQQIIGIPLQAIATSVTQVVLELIGVAATREGYVLVVNGVNIAVGEACNGMRMVFALALIVYAFVFATRVRLTLGVVLMLLSPLLAVLCNVIRLIPTTIILGYGTQERAILFHDLSGWAMLPVALLMLFGVLQMLRWLEFPVMRFRLAGR